MRGGCVPSSRNVANTQTRSLRGALTHLRGSAVFVDEATVFVADAVAVALVGTGPAVGEAVVVGAAAAAGAGVVVVDAGAVFVVRAQRVAEAVGGAVAVVVDVTESS